MDHHEFYNAYENIKKTLNKDVAKVPALIEAMGSVTISQKIELVDLFIESVTKEQNLVLFSRELFTDKALAHIGRMVVGRLISSSVNDIMALLEEASEKEIDACREFIVEIIDSVSVTELLENSSVEAVCNLMEELLVLSGDRIKDKLLEFVTTENRSLQVEAVKLLGSKATPLAIEVLIDSIEQDEALGILIVNQLSKVKSSTAIKGLISLLAMNNVKIRSFVEKKVEQIGTSVIGDLHQILESSGNNSNLLVSVLGLLTKFADPSSLKSVKRLINYFHENANVRAAAYMALAAINLQNGAPLLVDALRDPVDDVAFVASRALEKGCNNFIKEGVRNVILSSVYPVERLVEVFLFTESDKILRSLTDLEVVVSALNEICSCAGMEYYREKFKSVVTKETALLDESKSGRGLVWAIDDAPSVLNMYERFCIKSGLPLKTFDNPQQALKKLDTIKPDLIFVDLNMPDLNGVSFTNEVRAHYSKEELPIVLVTTQEGVDGDTNLKKDFFSEIIYKPFNEEALRAVQESIFNNLVI